MSIAWLAPDWPTPPGVRALSTFRSGGISSGRYESLNLGDHVGDEGAAVAANRSRLALAAKLPAEPCWLRQVHGKEVADVDAPVASNDASFTRRAGRVCAILSADCLPVLFASTEARVIGAAHAGWRGLVAGVLGATVRAMDEAPSALIAWIGPCIGPLAYEVGAEVRDAILTGMPAAAPAFEPTAAGRYRADLPGISRLQLQALGISRIYGGTQCTFSHPERYFSHRRDGQTGRQGTLIWLE